MTPYILSRAKILASRNNDKDNVYIVRVVPAMDSITEIGLLPEYPSFFYDKTEAYEQDDIVWCLHTEDYSIGYVLGLSESSTGRNLSLFIERVQEVERKFSLKLSQIEDLSFNIVEGVLLDFVDKETKINGRITSSGSSVIFTEDGSILLDSVDNYIHLDSDGDMELDSSNETHTVDKIFSVESNEINEKANSKEVNIAGNFKENVSGNFSSFVLGNTQESHTKDFSAMYGTKKKETIGTGADTKIVSGGQKTSILLGDYNVTAIAGSVNLTSGGGFTVTAGIKGVTITSTKVNINAPQITLSTLALNVKTLSLKVSPNILGGGPFCALPFCLFTGAPHTKSSYIGLGI